MMVGLSAWGPAHTSEEARPTPVSRAYLVVSVRAGSGCGPLTAVLPWTKEEAWRDTKKEAGWLEAWLLRGGGYYHVWLELWSGPSPDA